MSRKVLKSVRNRELNGSHVKPGIYSSQRILEEVCSHRFRAFLGVSKSDRHDLCSIASGFQQNVWGARLPLTCAFGRESRSYLCAITNENGSVVLLDTRPKATRPLVHEWQAHRHSVFDFIWIDGDRRCLTASGDTAVHSWDTLTGQRVRSFYGHRSSVRTVAGCPNQPDQFASGGRDGHLFLWDARTNERYNHCNDPMRSIKYAHGQAVFRKENLGSPNTITTVLYLTENIVMSAGANDGMVKCWDTRAWYRELSVNKAQKPLYSLKRPDDVPIGRGIVNMCMDPLKKQLFATYSNGRIYYYSLDDLQHAEPKEFSKSGFLSQSFDSHCAVSPDSRYLLTSTSRNYAMIWEINRPHRFPTFLVGPEECVTAVDWCPSDVGTLITVSDDLMAQTWRPPSGSMEQSDSLSMDLRTFCTLSDKQSFLTPSDDLKQSFYTPEEDPQDLLPSYFTFVPDQNFTDLDSSVLPIHQNFPRDPTVFLDRIFSSREENRRKMASFVQHEIRTKIRAAKRSSKGTKGQGQDGMCASSCDILKTISVAEEASFDQPSSGSDEDRPNHLTGSGSVEGESSVSVEGESSGSLGELSGESSGSLEGELSGGESLGSSGQKSNQNCGVETCSVSDTQSTEERPTKRFKTEHGRAGNVKPDAKRPTALTRRLSKRRQTLESKTMKGLMSIERYFERKTPR